MKYFIKQIIWYLAIFIKFVIFKIIKLLFHTQKPKKTKCFKKKIIIYQDIMTDDETDNETDDNETDDDD
jgi:hypothetical protein